MLEACRRESACRPITGTGERRAQACPLLHSMKGETMSTQAAQFAATFERLGRRMLAQLESFPEELWDRAPLIYHSDSLLTLATRLLDESDHWVLVVVGGREIGCALSVEASALDLRAT